MAKYLISFPSAAMVVPDGEWGAVGRDAHAVIDEAKAAGVYVFGGGIDEDVPPILVSTDGAVAMGGYPWAPTLDGGFTVLELPSRDEAIAWAARMRQGLSLRPRTARLRVRPAVLRAALKWRGKCGLTIHSSRTRFAGRLDSGVRASPCGISSLPRRDCVRLRAGACLSFLRCACRCASRGEESASLFAVSPC